MWKTLTYALRCQKQIILIVASSGVEQLIQNSKFMYQLLKTLFATFIKVLKTC
ncbi:hypothetical protein Lal_00033343 [Lupinus albus]|nr:hypothetical protein Lal_00033343 [Lupinus albus]